MATGCTLLLLHSSSVGLHQGSVKPADLTSQGFAGNERNIERATWWHIQMPRVAETAFKYWWLCSGEEDWSSMLRDGLVLGTETIWTKTTPLGKPWQSGCCAGSGNDLEDYDCGFWKGDWFWLRPVPFISVEAELKQIHKALPESPPNLLPNFF